MVNTPSNTVINNVDDSDICKDVQSRLDKEKVMNRGKWYSAMFSISDSLKYAAAILLPVAIALMVPELKAVADSGKSILQYPAALAATNLGSIGMGMLTAAAGIMGLGITTQYIGSRQMQSSQLDNSEMNALHTAKYISKELQKTKQAVIVVQPVQQNTQAVFQENQRADGKSWEQALQAQQAAKAQAAQTL